jgi:hypothetical protein
MLLQDKIFGISGEEDLNRLSLEVFQYQFRTNGVYRQFVQALGVRPDTVGHYSRIPFLPIEFFRTRRVACGNLPAEKIFRSSGTTGQERSSHEVANLQLYRDSLRKGFERFYGPPEDYHFLGLLPSPWENPESSLVFMVGEMMELSGKGSRDFLMHHHDVLERKLQNFAPAGEKVILIGLSYALLDFCSARELSFPSLIVMETGGMKGRRREMVREELHGELRKGFDVKEIHSEYGMTELLSQAYSTGEGKFRSPPWMKVMIRDINDPLHYIENGSPGGINVIDLANLDSCSFLATKDIGVVEGDSFRVLGRFDYSDLRGCNLMAG